MTSQRKENEIADLLKLMSTLPKTNTGNTFEEPVKKNTNWKAKTTNTISSKGRVNRTKGK
jgi:hypothetical protein